jgi:hypothetical protein
MAKQIVVMAMFVALIMIGQATASVCKTNCKSNVRVRTLALGTSTAVGGRSSATGGSGTVGGNAISQGGSATSSGNIANSLGGVSSATGGAGLVNGGNAVSQGGSSIALGDLIANSVAGDGSATGGDAIYGNAGSAAAFGGDSVSSTTFGFGNSNAIAGAGDAAGGNSAFGVGGTAAGQGGAAVSTTGVPRATASINLSNNAVTNAIGRILGSRAAGMTAAAQRWQCGAGNWNGAGVINSVGNNDCVIQGNNGPFYARLTNCSTRKYKRGLNRFNRGDRGQLSVLTMTAPAIGSGL